MILKYTSAWQLHNKNMAVINKLTVSKQTLYHKSSQMYIASLLYDIRKKLSYIKWQKNSKDMFRFFSKLCFKLHLPKLVLFKAKHQSVSRNENCKKILQNCTMFYFYQSISLSVYLSHSLCISVSVWSKT